MGKFNLSSFITKHRNEFSKKKFEINYKESELMELLCLGRDSFLKQPTMVEARAPITLVGDIHGQYSDLIRIFHLSGWPPGTNYMFLGDYVDRGRQSLECICLLLSLKIKYPDRVVILRGNHECAHINRMYGFYDECKRRFSHRLWMAFQDVFNVMPLTGCVSGRILCMHGGLSPELDCLDTIKNIQRPLAVMEPGLACDLLWADPEVGLTGWGRSNRGISWVFGEDVVKKFLKKQDLDLIVRAHQVVQQGYQFFGHSTLVTIFSAPNYCNEFDNRAAILEVHNDLSIKVRNLDAQDPS